MFSVPAGLELASHKVFTGPQLAVTETGNSIVVSSSNYGDHEIRDLVSWELVEKHHPKDFPVAEDDDFGIGASAKSADGRMRVCAERGPWGKVEIATPEKVRRCSFGGELGEPSGAVLSRDARFAAITYGDWRRGGEAFIIDTAAVKPLGQIAGPPSPAAIAFDPKSKFVIVTTSHGGLHRYTLPDLKHSLRFERPHGFFPTELQLAAGGSTLAAARFDDFDGRLCLFDANTGKLKASYSEDLGHIARWAVSPDGKMLALARACHGTSIELYRLTPEGLEAVISADDRLRLVGVTREGESAQAVALAGGGELRRWELTTGLAVGTPVPLSPEAVPVVAAEAPVAAAQTAEGVVVVNLADGAQTSIPGAAEHPLALSRDGALLLTRAGSTAAALWRTADGSSCGYLGAKHPYSSDSPALGYYSSRFRPYRAAALRGVFVHPEGTAVHQFIERSNVQHSAQSLRRDRLYGGEMFRRISTQLDTSAPLSTHRLSSRHLPPLGGYVLGSWNLIVPDLPRLARDPTISPDFHYAVYATAHQIWIHDLYRGRPVARLDTHRGSSHIDSNNAGHHVHRIEFLPKGELLTAGSDGLVFVWDFQAIVREAGQLADREDVKWSPAG